MFDVNGPCREIKRWLRSSVVDVIAYLDTVELFLPYVPTGTRKRLEAAVGHRVRIKPSRDRNGAFLIVNQPNIPALILLGELRHATLCRFHIALDLITRTQARGNGLRNWFVYHLKLRWRPNGPMHDEQYGAYWEYQTHRKAHQKKRSARDLVVYSSEIKLCKITGEPCTHVEIRFQNARACRAQNVYRVRDLIILNPRKLFSKHLALALSFDPRAIAHRAMRDAVREDCQYYQGHPTSAFVDQYRASIKGRVRSLFERYGFDRATFNKTKSYPLNSVFPVPNQLYFKRSSRIHLYSKGGFVKNPNDFNQPVLLY